MISLNSFKFDMLQVMNVFVLFLRVCSGESASVLFSPTATNTDSEILSYLVQVNFS